MRVYISVTKGLIQWCIIYGYSWDIHLQAHGGGVEQPKSLLNEYNLGDKVEETISTLSEKHKVSGFILLGRLIGHFLKTCYHTPLYSLHAPTN